MLRSKRIITLFVLTASIAFLALTLQPLQGVEAKQSKPVTITFATWNWDSAEQEANWTEAIKEFEQQNPNIRVELHIVHWSKLAEKLRYACQAGNPEDVGMLPMSKTIPFIKAGYLYDITPWVKRDLNLDDFLKKTWTVTYKGRWYGLPWRRGAFVLFYNKDAFKDVGIIYWPETVDELFTVIKKLTRDINGDGKIDQYGYGIVGKNCKSAFNRWASWLYAYGGEILNVDGTAVADNFIEKATKAFGFFDYLMRNGLADPSAPLNAGDDNIRLFGVGRTAMIQEMGTGIPQLMGMNPAFEVGYGLIPRGAEKGEKWWSGRMSGWDILIFKEAKHPKAAWEFVKYWLSTKNQIKCVQTLPVRKSAMRAEKFQKVPEALRKAPALAHPVLAHPREVEIALIIRDQLEKIVYSRTFPEAAAKEAAAKINELLSK